MDDSQKLVRLVLSLTGREDRLQRSPLLDPMQEAGVRAIWPDLRDSTTNGLVPDAKCDLFNRLLLTLGIKTVAPRFFRVVFKSVDFSKLDQVQERVERFRALCMYEFGSFRFGYKTLRTGAKLDDLWKLRYPDADDSESRATKLRGSPRPVGLHEIPPSQLFALGYLATEQSLKINRARKKLLTVIDAARLFNYYDEMTKVYNALDANIRQSRDEMIDVMIDKGLIEEKVVSALRGPEKTKNHVVAEVLRNAGDAALRKLDKLELDAELIRQGYEPPSDFEKLVAFCVETMDKLERRALTFKEIHPLSLQTSPLDGVARGMIVTRTVVDTARILRGLLRGTLEFEVVEEPENWLLVDKITRSPVRVVTKNAILTTAFWSEFAEEESQGA